MEQDPERNAEERLKCARSQGGDGPFLIGLGSAGKIQYLIMDASKKATQFKNGQDISIDTSPKTIYG